MRLRALALRALPFLLASACTSSAELSVDVVSDFVPHAEFDLLQLELDGVVVFEGLPEGDWSAGVRVADLEAGEGDREIRARLLRDETSLVERAVVVRLAGSRGVTITLARACRDVDCSSGGANLACQNEECVDPRCTPETPEFCGEASCGADTECDSGAQCGAGRCVFGTCLVVDDGSCGANAYCDPDVGCQPLPTLDAGVDDAGVDDAGLDASFDAGADAGTDAPADARDGCEYPPFGCLEPRQYVATGLDRGGRGTTNISLFPHRAMPTGAMTLEMWIQFLSPPAGEAPIAGNSDGGRGFRLAVRDDMVIYTVNGRPYELRAAGLIDQAWHHIALTRERGSLCFLIDGEPRDCNTTYDGAAPDSSIDTIYIGRDNPGDTPNAHIGVHHLRIWSEVRSPDKIKTYRFRAVNPSPTLLVEFSMQSARVDGTGVTMLGGSPTSAPLQAILGWWGEPRGNSPAEIVLF